MTQAEAITILLEATAERELSRHLRQARKILQARVGVLQVRAERRAKRRADPHRQRRKIVLGVIFKESPVPTIASLARTFEFSKDWEDSLPIPSLVDFAKVLRRMRDAEAKWKSKQKVTKETKV